MNEIDEAYQKFREVSQRQLAHAKAGRFDEFCAMDDEFTNALNELDSVIKSTLDDVAEKA